MSIKKALMYSLFGSMVFLLTCATLMYAWAYVEKKKVLLTTSFTLTGHQQKFKAFYLPAPAEGFEVKLEVSNGMIKFSHSPALEFEDSLGYFDYYVNGTVEKRQLWLNEIDNGTVGVSAEDPLWYLLFYNEESCEKEIHVQITKVWREQNYQSWINWILGN